MGIRPDRMQALAWGLAAASAGIAGALMAISYPWSPSVGETFGLTAFVVVTLGGFGSVPGAMYAGLIIGLIQALSAFYFGPIYKDIVVYRAVRRVALVPPAGPVGQGLEHHERCRRALLPCCLCYPFVFSNAFYLDIGVALLLAAISASRLEHRRRLRGAGLGRPLHVLRRRRLFAAARLSSLADCRRCVGVPVGILVELGPRRRSSACRRSACRATTSAWRRSRSPN